MTCSHTHLSMRKCGPSNLVFSFSFVFVILCLLLGNICIFRMQQYLGSDIMAQQNMHNPGKDIGVRGNERADLAAKSALDLSPKAISIPYTDLKPIISKFLHKKWQQRWDMNINNKLFQIQPTLEEWRPAFRASRREQVIISQLCIGHTRLTHAFILKQEPQPQCLMCQTTCTVKHIVIECRALRGHQKAIFQSD